MKLKSLLKKNKKGQILGTVSNTIVGLMVLLFLIFAVLFGIATLKPSTFFTANSAEANTTAAFQANITQGVGEFGVQIPNIFKVLAVVVILAAVLLLILYVRRMQQVGGGGGGPGL